MYHDYNETVLDTNGTVLWNIANVADPVSVDEDGFVYSVPARVPDEEYTPHVFRYAKLHAKLHCDTT